MISISLAISSSDFMDSLNRETLRVTGLTASKYNLKIDGEDAGTFSKEELHLMRDGLGFLSVYFRRSPHQLEEQG